MAKARRAQKPVPLSQESQAQLKELRRLLEKGKTLTQAAKKLRVSTATVYRRVARHLPDIERRKHPPMGEDERENILKILGTTDGSLQKIADMVSRSRWTVFRLRNRLYRLENEPDLEVCVRTVRKPVRCKCGALVKVLPCIACAAKKAKGQS